MNYTLVLNQSMMIVYSISVKSKTCMNLGAIDTQIEAPMLTKEMSFCGAHIFISDPPLFGNHFFFVGHHFFFEEFLPLSK